MPLTESQAKNAKPREQAYKLADAGVRALKRAEAIIDRRSLQAALRGGWLMG
jgi:hypothetical protein